MFAEKEFRKTSVDASGYLKFISRLQNSLNLQGIVLSPSSPSYNLTEYSPLWDAVNQTITTNKRSVTQRLPQNHLEQMFISVGIDGIPIYLKGLSSSGYNKSWSIIFEMKRNFYWTEKVSTLFWWNNRCLYKWSVPRWHNGTGTCAHC